MKPVEMVMVTPRAAAWARITRSRPAAMSTACLSVPDDRWS